jgi:hypothetical protein
MNYHFLSFSSMAATNRRHQSFGGRKIAVSDDKRRISNPKQPENSTKLTLFYRFLPVSKKGENGKSPMF